MNGHASTQLDILLIGAGISGINAAFRIQESLPDASYVILEARHEIGGTWSLFKYPGIRSDSDMYTFGFPFHPWVRSNPIASGESILEYMNETAEKFDIKKKIRYRHRVVCAEWREDQQRWKVDVEIDSIDGEAPSRVVFWTKWILTGTGYYNYDEALKADIPGLDSFKGTTVHPQFWPQNLDYKDKKVIIIGSGATTITLMPALVDTGVGSVTQLQRSPSFIMSLPQEKPAWWEKHVPVWFVANFKRSVFAFVATLLHVVCTAFPARASKFFQKQAKHQLPAGFVMDPHFKPSYNPWEQRLCLCPDGDYFKCFSSGRAHIVTDTIKTVVGDGIELNSGKKLDAEIIITATGLNLKFLGGIVLKVSGKEVNIGSEYLWRGSMLTSLPNFGNFTRYWHASWTLGSDNSARLFTRLIKYQIENNYTKATPVISEADRKDEVPTSPMKSTYVERARSRMPKSASRGPWRPRANYFVDRWQVLRMNPHDGLKWEKIST